MDLLGLIYGMATVLVPLVVLSTARAAVEYRSVGIHRQRLLRGASTILLGSLCWSGAAVVLLVLSPWSLGLDAGIRPSHAVLAGVPVVLGWIPGLLLLVLGAAPTSGTLDTVPGWARWMDALWTA